MEHETPKREWNGYNPPIRQLVLWGWNNDHIPAFCILYGIQEQHSSLLGDHVNYEMYYVFSGTNGHLPSFPRIEAKWFYNRNKRQSELGLFVGGSTYDWYEQQYTGMIPSISIKDKPITLSYYEDYSYSTIIQEIRKQYGEFSGFHFAENPNEILKFDPQYEGQFEKLCRLFSDPNRYMRKKHLNELLDEKLPKDFYEHIIKIGSTELVAGIFLNLAKRRDPMLLELAERWKDMEPFGEKPFMDGVERCATIYLNSIDEEKRQARESDIHNHLSEMDLHILRLEKTDELGPLEGKFYHKYAKDGTLCPYEDRYEREALGNGRWRWHTYQVLHQKCFYRKGLYNDGRTLDIIALKHTLQEAEIYNLPDVIGKIAYYIDAPRLFYYFSANKKNGARDYFRRYLKRLINHYAQSNINDYMEIMKVLFGSYQSGDYVSKFPGNFQQNYFIRQYLYPNLSLESFEYNTDQFLEHDGRFEAYPEIWDQHLKETADIAISSEVEDVVKACYFILKDNMEKGRLKSQLDNSQVIELFHSSYSPLKKLAGELLADVLKNVEIIDPSLLLALLKSDYDYLKDIAFSFIEKNEISPELLVSILLIKENTDWYPVWKEKISSLSETQMLSFFKALFTQKKAFLEWNFEEPFDFLHVKSSEFANYQLENKRELFNFFSSMLLEDQKLPKQLLDLIQSTFFSFGKKDLKIVLEGICLENSTELLQENARILTMLRMIQQDEIIDSNQILDLIEHGNGQTIQLLLDLLDDHMDILAERTELFLMFAESPILSLNHAAKRLLKNIPLQKREMLICLLIGSPKERAYSLGISQLEESYNSIIPKEFLLMMLEHPSEKVKAYIAKKSEQLIEKMGNGNMDLFLYYVKTLLYLPNKTAKSKQLIYQKLPCFVKKYPQESGQVEAILLDIGGSNCKKDSEQALVALAKIRNEV